MSQTHKNTTKKKYPRGIVVHMVPKVVVGRSLGIVMVQVVHMVLMVVVEEPSVVVVVDLEEIDVVGIADIVQ